MRIDIQTNHIELHKDMLETVKAKIQHLDHYYENIHDVTVFFKEERELKHIEVKLHLQGTVLFIEEHGDSFQHALDKAIDASKTQLRKHKEKHQVKPLKEADLAEVTLNGDQDAVSDDDDEE